MNENKKFSISNMMLAFITVLVVIGLVALAGFFLLTPPDDIIMGQAEATQVRISGKVPGRINAVVITDVPDYSIAVGVPAQIKPRRRPD